MLEMLNVAGFDFAQAGGDGRTALHYAGTAGKVDVVEFLVGVGVDVGVVDVFGNTAMDNAKACGHCRIVELLSRHVK
jgi:ankyrin repeat protein